MKRLILSLWMALAPALVQAETQWPRFQGVFVQLITGDVIELPNVVNTPGRNRGAFPKAVLDNLPVINPNEIETIIAHGIDEFFNHGELNGQITVLLAKQDVPNQYEAKFGPVVIWDRGIHMPKYGVEFGPNHSMIGGVRTFALHAKPGIPLYLSTVPLENGKNAQVLATYIKPAVGVDGWAFKTAP